MPNFIHLVREYKIREEHALLWFLGLGGAVVVVWVDPLLAALTGALGVDVPASALLLLALFFLFVIAVRLTSEVFLHKAQINQLYILTSVLREQINDHDGGWALTYHSGVVIASDTSPPLTELVQEAELIIVGRVGSEHDWEPLASSRLSDGSTLSGGDQTSQFLGGVKKTSFFSLAL